MNESYFGEHTGKLGFGLMRLPKTGEEIDVEQTKQMVDLFLDAGFTYFDTAFVYAGSEEATKKALVDRYPRESYTLATKLNAAMQAENEQEAKRQFYTSLERTGAGYFDYYLLHAFMRKNYRKYDEYHLWDFVKEQKEKGLIRHLGFSFHSGPDLLDRILTAHPEVDFVQLQINYADWEDEKIASRANYEMARKHGKSIVVMEPVKGGSLADPPGEVKELFRSHNPEMSYASWAIRFVASLPGIITVLSGMSNVEQMKDNLSYMKDFQPLNPGEQRIIQKAQRIMGNSATVPCTGCQYCMDGCPVKIPIPDIFAAVNKQIGNGLAAEAKKDYSGLRSGGNAAADCVECGQCERVCPQGIAIPEKLKQAAVMFG